MLAQDTDEAIAAYVDALAIIHQLVIEPDWRPMVLANMKAVAQAAQLVLTYPFGDHDEAAPVFSA